MNTPRWKAAPNNRGQRWPAQREEESSAALGLSEHRHASGRGGGVRCRVPYRPCSEAVWLYTFKLNRVCPMPATFTGRHCAVSGDLQGQVTAGQDPGRQTLLDARPRPPLGPRPHTGHAPHRGCISPKRTRGEKLSSRPDTLLKGNRGEEGTKGMVGSSKQRR